MTTRIKEERREIKFVKLTNDSLFKVTFGRIDNRKFLEDLLECYYGYPNGYLHKRLKVSYESIQDKAKFKEMNTRNDIVVQFDNTYTNLEMYTTFNEEAYDKSTFYVMRISRNQLLIGDTYKQLQKVTQINFIESDKINISEDFRSIKTIGNKIEQESG